MRATNNLFAYGTLMWPEVLTTIIGRKLQGAPASLKGYRRLRVKGEHYPVVVPSAADAVEGIVYSSLTNADFEHLDRFEGDEYERIGVRIDGLEVQVYVLSEHHRHIADAVPWHPEDMQPGHLAAFFMDYKGWRSMQ